jgi:hypothetical protein
MVPQFGHTQIKVCPENEPVPGFGICEYADQQVWFGLLVYGLFEDGLVTFGHTCKFELL